MECFSVQSRCNFGKQVLSIFFNGNYNNDNNGLLKYTQWHKNCELQCAYMIQEIKLHLF